MRYFFTLSLLVLALLSACQKEAILQFDYEKAKKELQALTPPPPDKFPPEPDYTEKPVIAVKKEAEKSDTQREKNDGIRFDSCTTTPRNAEVTELPYQFYGTESDRPYAGKVTIKGIIMSDAEDYFYEKLIRTANIVLVNPQDQSGQLFYENIRQGNTSTKPMFKLGMVEDGLLKTTAHASESTREKIMNALNRNIEVELTLKFPLIVDGVGTPPHYTSACAIE